MDAEHFDRVEPMFNSAASKSFEERSRAPLLHLVLRSPTSRALFLAGLCIAAHVNAHAQEPAFTELPVWSAGTAEPTSDVALGDMDGDGDLDLVCGNHYGGNSLYRNEGGVFGATAIWSGSALADSTTSIALGDVDGDGDLDLVCGNTDFFSGGPLRTTLYRNDDGVLTGTPVWSSQYVDFTEDVALGDIDADGDLDLVCATYFGATLYRNDDGTFTSTPVWSPAPTTLEATVSVALGDVDGDGDLDLVCGNEFESNTLYRNDGGILAAIPAWSSDQANATRSVVLGDIDGDGDLDLACGNGGFKVLESDTLYRNDGGVFTGSPIWTAEPLPTMSVALGDVDGDGDLDLVCGMDEASDRFYRNEGGVLAQTPEWSSSLANSTASVSLADVDGDGDLDLVCGNGAFFHQSSTLYRNYGGPPFAEPVTWYNQPLEYTESVAIGDVDGDGDLDLVCGNFQQRNTTYRNENGVFTDTPVWSSASADSTRSVALGDVDGDGDLDLVCGNEGESNTLHRNDGDGFTAMPVWSSQPANHTTSVALGDVDGDGDLDLVCGNWYESSALYRNEGGTFTASPIWSWPPQSTASVTLGDVDGDGDLDLVLGNSFHHNAVYRNDTGAFTSSPVWSSRSDENTLTVALGDVDSDGDLDLVCGNGVLGVESNTLYRNDGDTFTDLPIWSSDKVSNSNVALGDVDGDGDLDLVCGNLYRGNTLYRNDGGAFTIASVWSTGLGFTTSMALGDVDRDGDLDIVLGHAQGSALRHGTRNPVYKWNPEAPTHHLPNNGAHLRWVGEQRIDPNVRRIHVRAVDVESDPIWVVPDFQYEGVATWHPAVFTSSGRTIGPLTSSPTGEEHEFTWDASTVPFDDRNVILRLRIVSIPRGVGAIQHAPSYFLPVGPISPSRPEFSPSLTSLEFPPVTLGDTVSLTLTVTNTGTEPLEIEHIDPPSSEIRIAPSPPLYLAAGGREQVDVSLSPRMELSVAGNVTFMSNDPLTPVATIPVMTEIHDLIVETQGLAQGPEIVPGDAFTVLVIPADEVIHVERGSLWHRPAGVGEFSPIELTPQGRSFVGIVPGTAVSELGLEFYVEVENSGIFRTDPAEAPDSVFFQAVKSPDAIVATVNSGRDVIAGFDAPIQVLLGDGIEFVDGTVHYRVGGRKEFSESSFQAAGRLLAAEIPAEAIGPRGLDYWVRITTATTTLTDPQDYPDSTRTIRVVVPKLEEVAGPAQDGRYRMVSVPLDFSADFTLADLLGDEAAFGPYDITKWRAFRYRPTAEAGRYVELGETEFPEEHTLQLGKGFWITSRLAGVIETDPVAGVSTPTSGAYPIRLEPGWNQFGSPFAFPVAWSSVAQLSPSVDGPVEFDPLAGVAGEYLPDPPATLVPFRGYFIHNPAQAETLWIPPVEATDMTPREPFVADGWSGRIEALTDAGASGAVTVGTHSASTDNHDPLDRLKPPSAPTPWISLAIANRDWRQGAGLYRRDLRSISAEGHQWSLEILTESRGEVVTLTCSLSGDHQPAAIRLLDPEQNTSVHFAGAATFELLAFGPDRPYRLVLVAGTEDYVEREGELIDLPVALLLDRNAPNPFRPSTRIRFGIPRPMSVRLNVYDLGGRQITGLVDQPLDAGYHAVIWDGRDRFGQRVASGVYFYRLETEMGIKSRKMVLLR